MILKQVVNQSVKKPKQCFDYSEYSFVLWGSLLVLLQQIQQIICVKGDHSIYLPQSLL